MLRPLVVQGSPEAPTDLTAAATDGATVALAWSAPIFPPPVVAYALERADNEGFRDGRTSLSAPAGEPSLTDDSAQAGHTYFYRVRAEAAAGYSPWSAPAEVELP